MSTISLLLSPNLLGIANRTRRWSRNRWFITVGFLVFSLFFFGGLGFGIYKFMHYLHQVPLIGAIIIEKLIQIGMISFFGFLVFSNIVTSISTYYLSEDLNLLMSLPVPIRQLHRMKFLETTIESSWMIVLFSLPLFIPLGIVFDAGPKYYILISLMWPPFLVIPAVIGSIISTVLINIFPARRIREVLLALGFLTLFGMLMLMLYLEPARWIDPDRALNVAEYVTSLAIPDSSFMPSTWATRVISGLARNDSRAIYFLVLLLLNGAVYFAVGDFIITKLMRRGLTKAAEARTIRFTKNFFFERLLRVSTGRMPSTFAAILKKDLKIMLRDTSQWSQLVILSAIVIMYLYAISVYPLDMFQSWIVYIQNTVSFLNIGLVGFMISAISVRFIYPSISLEGRSYWFVRSSPLTINQLVLSKYMIFGLPIFFIGMLLVVMANLLLGVPNLMMLMTISASVFVLLAVISIVMGYGVGNPEFNYENVAKLALGFNAVTCVILSSTYIAICMSLLFVPITMVMRQQLADHTFPLLYWLGALLCVIGFVVFSIYIIVAPIRWGINRLHAREF
jgi:ABC-2 type transport system permease protein